MSEVLNRINALRTRMRETGLSAWVALTGDPHAGEYLPADWAVRRYLSGFTGSAGTLVVTLEKAALWTDSRYWDQAKRELEGSTISLMRDGDPATASVVDWMLENLSSGDTVGIDAASITACAYDRLETQLAAAEIALVDDAQMIDSIWTDRPAARSEAVFAFETAQQPRRMKLERVREAVGKAGAEALVLSAREDIAWLTNLRGGDIPCTPVFTAHLLVLEDGATLYIDASKVNADIRDSLAEDGISLAPYGEAFADIARQCEGLKVFVDSKKICARLYETLVMQETVEIVKGIQPTTLMKSRKSEAELSALREIMLEDGAAMVELLAWIDEQLREERPFTERDVSDKLLTLRRARAGFIEPSFTTIAAFGANAAEPHYTPKAEGSASVTRGEMLLIDSGGQYTGGTTDITRTVAIGDVSRAMKRDYTAVLRAHIALAMLHFPRGAWGAQLDTAARLPLWEIGADYGHGTGHGVGFCLSVHEGPVSISPRSGTSPQARVETGLVLSNEPGVYRTGRWGVRIENLVTPVVADYLPDQTSEFLNFETLTLCPIDTRMILTAMMTPVEIWWVNDYHKRVREALMPRVSGKAAQWLMRATEII